MSAISGFALAIWTVFVWTHEYNNGKKLEISMLQNKQLERQLESVDKDNSGLRSLRSTEIGELEKKFYVRHNDLQNTIVRLQVELEKNEYEISQMARDSK